MYEKVSPKPEAVEQETTEKATSMLDRVKVMRVFDFAGVVEAIGEVGEMWEAVSRAREGAKEREAPSNKATEGIADSEDEIEEMLDDFPNQESLSSETPLLIPSNQTGQSGVIVVDTSTNVVSAMMSKSQVQGKLSSPHPT